MTCTAGYLATTRQTVYLTLSRWIEEGVPGLEDKPPIPKHPKRKVDVRVMNEVRKLQENPELGEFRVHARLKHMGINLSPRTCGRILALNRALYGLKGPVAEPKEPKAMPFRATRRHQYWTVDIRYLDMHRLGGGKTLSARHYAQWDTLAPVIQAHRDSVVPPIVPEIASCHSIVYTPAITITPRRLAIELEGLQLGMTRAVEAAQHPEDYDDVINVAPGGTHVELIVIDEADRLKFLALEQARDI